MSIIFIVIALRHCTKLSLQLTPKSDDHIIYTQKLVIL